jgi:GT2 family glycosyltransferase
MHSIVVLVLAWNGERWLWPCLSALQAQEYQGRHAVLVVDNGSSDASPDLVAAEFPAVALLRLERNHGFAGGNNVGIAALRTLRVPGIDFVPDVIVLLNQDTVVESGWLSALDRAFVDHPEAGVVGCKIFGPDGLLQHVGGALEWPLATPRHLGAGERDHGQYDTDAVREFVTGAALALSRSALDALGGLDEGFRPAYYEDTDLCYRARAAGFGVIYAHDARLLHHENTSLGAQSVLHQRALHRNRLRFVLRHGDLAAFDSFVSAERAAIASWSTVDSGPRKLAYLAALSELTELLQQRATAAGVRSQDSGLRSGSAAFERVRSQEPGVSSEGAGGDEQTTDAEPATVNALDRAALAQTLSAALRQLYQTASREEYERREENIMSGIRSQEPTLSSAGLLAQAASPPHSPRAAPSLANPMHEDAPMEEKTAMNETTPLESYSDPVDIAAIMRQIRRKIDERQSRDTGGELDQALELINHGYNIYQPLSLPPAASLPGRAWDVFRTRLHHEVRGYLDTMIFKQTEFNTGVVRAINNLTRRSRNSASVAEVESLRDEIIVLREEIRRLREELQR